MTKLVTADVVDYSTCLLPIDSYFNIYVEPKWDLLSEIKYTILNEVDNSTYIGDHLVKSVFGYGRLADISTSAKTCLTILYMKEIEQKYSMVSLNECGPKAVKMCIKLLEDSNIIGWYNQVETPLFDTLIEVDGKVVSDAIEYGKAAVIWSVEE